ncbi:MAG: pseudouridine synthase [Firmicutes bacterium]|nr:pseudouridine synthase [Bacillota bacterium]
MRIAKYLAQTGIASRRHAEEYIAEGRVRLNGIVVSEMSTLVDPQTDRIEFDGRPVQAETPVYILLHKPPGYITSASDPQGRATVLELVRDVKQRIYPVGRLDYDTSGLLLLTNDGEFTNLMIHPRYKIEKEYQACVSGRIMDQELQILSHGVVLEDGLTAPAQIRLISRDAQASVIRITIHEGRNRQIKRMCAAIGHPLLRLSRIGLGFLSLEELGSGQYRNLHLDEVERLKGLALYGAPSIQD